LKVSIITPDISHNCLGRAYVLAQVLSYRFDVEIVGAQSGTGVWQPLAEEASALVRGIPVSSGLASLMAHLPEISKMADGDVVLVSKPLPSSYYSGLLASRRRRRPLVLDIDDWEVGLRGGTQRSWQRRARDFAAFLVRHNSYLGALACERLVPRADAVIAASAFLQRRFGGALLPHVRDTDSLDPARYSRAKWREQLGLAQSDTLVGFVGTPHPHKGIEDLIGAIGMIGDRRTHLLVAGLDEGPYSRHLRAVCRTVLAGATCHLIDQVPYGAIPEILAAVDIVVLPQRDCPQALGQMPAKLFDALAMGKAIVASDVSDIAQVLEGCGVVVPAGETAHLAEAIRELVKSPQIRSGLESAARERAVSGYSVRAVRDDLCRFVGGLVGC